MDEKPSERESYVSIQNYGDGTVRVNISGQNGQSLSLVVNVTDPEPMASIPKTWAGRGFYRAAVQVLANGHLKGWLIDQQNDQLLWFPERAKPKRKRTKKSPPMRGRKGDR